MSLGREPSPMELFVETHMRSKDCQKGVQQFVVNRAQHFVVSSSILFRKLLFFLNWIWWFIFHFQETYNSRLRERYGDDPSTHLDFDPDLWMEVGSSGGLDKNRVYGLSNTTTENLWAAHSVSIVGSFQSVLSTQYKEFVALQQHTAHLTEKYEQLLANYEQLS
jgi:hypothetical protein